jgi:hypothetical protein
VAQHGGGFAILSALAGTQVMAFAGAMAIS